ncbi:hypothetical protein LCGC14_1842870 [marine sediment metagenome]|uniref:Uncharacterized protein n=1 Tax=marine sediment metagenome TaxID=412755 RepID=A0A0F9JBY4_9ZZZZ
MRFELGKEAKDVITGFKGLIVGYVEYLTGCNQYLVTPPVDKEGKHVDSQWFDENRIELVGTEKAIVLDPKKEKANGPCEPAPIK